MKNTLTILLFCLVFSAFSAEIRGVCVSVHDGDTLTLLADGQKHKIRLAVIDAPELKQPYGTISRDFLSAMVLNREITVEYKKPDLYGRLIGHIRMQERDVNLLMLLSGLAWHYSKYDRTQKYADAEAFARKYGLGLWADPDPVPPWKFR